MEKGLTAMSNRLVNRTKFLKTLTSLAGVLGISALITLPVFSQSIPSRYGTVVSQNTTNVGRVILSPSKGNGISGVVNYPYGSRVNTAGVVTTPNGTVLPPSVTVNNGDGSVTYYYRDGSRINTNGTTVRPTGVPITR